MADPRKKTPVEARTFRLHLPRVSQLVELAERRDSSQNQVINDLIAEAHVKLMRAAERRASK